MEGKIKYLKADNMSSALKFATTALNYPSLKGVPIDRVETHSLRYGIEKALLLAGSMIEIYKNWEDGKGKLLRNT